ncbi:MAG TPA: type I-F CRISPR-associated endoribonuclease Cas6/Csy4, partial [Pseudomonadales bacterium]|nr:type I-F CRISPR-associated endoribonuclease Cas6/Csy4 [Pseudomonadales bacterium]
MEYYLDIHLLPDPEFSEQELMNALFAKFHRAMNNVAQG